nr:LLM class flavin-dependent oxidoreductase [Streptomyces sp. IB2014 016-6]
MWTTEPVARHEGRHYAFPAAHIGPKPLQRPWPSIYLSGFAPASRRRAARRADGVLPVAVPVPGSAFDPATVINQPLHEVRRIAEAEGRDPAAIDAILRINPTTESTVPEIAEIILRTGDETDVDHVFVDFVHLGDQGVDQALELLRQTLELSR